MKWKIIRIYLVDADTRTEALERMAVANRVGSEDDYFQTEIVKKQEEEPGWIAQIKNQIFPAQR